MGKTKTVNNTSQQRDPYAAAAPGLQSAGAGVTNWMNSPQAATSYSGPRVAQMSGQTQRGLDAMTASTGARQAESYLSDTVGGKYLATDNPYLQQLQDATRASVMPSINSRVSSSGMAPGSSVDQALVGREMTRAMAQPLFNTYQNERGLQQQAAGMLPGVSQGIIGNQINAGQLAEGYDQRNIDAQRQAFEEARIAGLRPYAQGTDVLAKIGASGGTTTETSTRYVQPSPVQQIVGGAMMAGSLFTPTGMFGGGLPGLGMFGGGGLTPGMRQAMDAQGIPIEPGQMGPMVPYSQGGMIGRGYARGAA
jgi:hypothetical protein